MTFLQKIRYVVADDTVDGTKRGEGIFDDIRELGEEILERVASIEDGSYWDDSDNWDDSYDDDDPDDVTEEQLDELENLFMEVDSLFLGNNLQLAQIGYQLLFELLEETGIDPAFFSETEIRETRARYCRCVYESTPGETRLDHFLRAMEVDLFSQWQIDSLFPLYPTLQDVIDAKPGTMEGVNTFLSEMKAVLLKADPAGRRAVLLAEIVNAGNMALSVIQKPEFRWHIASFMLEAGTELGDLSTILLGKRECFFARTSEQSMLYLLDEATRQDARDEELGVMLGFLKSREDSRLEIKLLLVIALLASGKLEEAFEMVQKSDSLGWSHGSTGLVFAALLASMTGDMTEAGTINQMLEQYADEAPLYFGYDTLSASGRLDLNTKSSEEIKKGLTLIRQSVSKHQKYLAWADKIGRDRIGHIVSNKHRGAYARAAQVMGALLETWSVVAEKDKAMDLFTSFYHEKFNRFSAFRKEVKRVVSQSRVLKNLNLRL